MLCQASVFHPHDVGSNPCSSVAASAKPPVQHHIVALCHNHSRFIPQCLWQAFDELEQAFASGRDVSAVLDIVGRPKALSRDVIALVEQGFEGFKDERFVLFLACLTHFHPPRSEEALLACWLSDVSLTQEQL